MATAPDIGRCLAGPGSHASHGASDAVSAVPVSIPIAFRKWAATIEQDVLVHGLTDDEIEQLIAALKDPAKD